MNLCSLSGRVSLSALLALGAVGVANEISNAQTKFVPPTPVVGSSNPISAEPRITRPLTTHCTATLFTNEKFADFNTKNFNYTPPSDCPGPYSKIVFEADFTVTEGRQFDRTAQFFLGGANLYFGTTAEPRATLSPSWHVENDVTDLSSLLHHKQAGTAILGNFVGTSGGVDYTGIIYSNAHLVFYEANQQYPAAKVPDVVVGIPGNSGAGTSSVTGDVVSTYVTLPTNTEAAYLDVIAQSQGGDEFWYLCVPDSLAGQLQSCGGTGFRETEISIDGVAAGVAPVYPWIYTGGIDPYLWEPITGVQTLDFKPFRVDLTPFAGVLADGKSHAVGISVFNTEGYFAVEGNLLAYTDKGSHKTTGRVTANNLNGTPKETITNGITTDGSGNIGGSVTVASQREYTIVGTLNTSHGVVTTRVDGQIGFSNKQTFVLDNSEYKQYLVQSTDGAITTTTTGGSSNTVASQTFSYPFTFDYDEVVNADGTIVIHNISNQKYVAVNDDFGPGYGDPAAGGGSLQIPYVVGINEQVFSSDDLNYDASGNFKGHGGHSYENYLLEDSKGKCYSQSLTATKSVLTGYTNGVGCK